MELCFDTGKTYAVALEGGGAKGAYQVGVWQALEEAGVKYNAVSGTSVGALNGALMTMRDLPAAIRCWSEISLSKVINVKGFDAEDLKKLITGEVQAEDLTEMLPQAFGLLKNRGLDIGPLRAWVHEIADPKKIKEPDVQFYLSTVSLTDIKGLEVHVNELPEDQICDMLLASAYHPGFRLEKLGGKFYTDGGFVDSLPIHALVENGYKDIIAVRQPAIGWERRFKMPDDVSITTVQTSRDLGRAMDIDAEVCRRRMAIGYLDCKRVLYGLRGRKYYLDRTLSEREALEWILDHEGGKSETLRACLEKDLPRTARQMDAEDADYYELMTLLLEQKAEEKGLTDLKVYLDRDLIELAED